jgi:RNA polymerase sigma-70 factor (ECF subfamily)
MGEHRGPTEDGGRNRGLTATSRPATLPGLDARLAGNAEGTIGELYHACYRRLVAQVFAFTTDLGEAQDVVQEAFARALARPQGLADVENPEAWLRTVAINVIRRRWRRRRVLDTILLRDRPVTRVVAPGPEPDNADLRHALAAIAQPFREVIVLHYLADLAVDDVAALLEVPVGTVKSRLSRARAALAKLLDDYRTEPVKLTDHRAEPMKLANHQAAGVTRIDDPEVAHA